MMEGWFLRICLWLCGWFLILISHYFLGIMFLSIYAFLVYDTFQKIKRGEK